MIVFMALPLIDSAATNQPSASAQVMRLTASIRNMMVQPPKSPEYRAITLRPRRNTVASQKHTFCGNAPGTVAGSMDLTEGPASLRRPVDLRRKSTYLTGLTMEKPDFP